MKRLVLFVLLAAGAPALSGCLPMMAMSAASMAVQGARGTPVSNQGLQPRARDACSRQAAQYGTVNVIDVEQHRVDKIIVWGTVGEGARKRSFECDFGTTITAFKLREIHAEQ
ncbi:MAG: hypothetical protein HOP95_06115 [Sphingomonas sp.]|nr:hypothetical protein [Sphingomonas sp.]